MEVMWAWPVGRGEGSFYIAAIVVMKTQNLDKERE
jgi:hypothetical protein